MNSVERQKITTIITKARKEGKTTQEVADLLNQKGFTTGRGYGWTDKAVNNFSHRARVSGKRVPRLRKKRSDTKQPITGQRVKKNRLPAIKAILDLDLPASERVALAQLVLDA